MRNVRRKEKLKGLCVICLAAMAAFLFFAAQAMAWDNSKVWGKHKHKPPHFKKPELVVINDGRGTTKMNLSKPPHFHHSPRTLTAVIKAKPYPGFTFVQWNVYGEQDSVTLEDATKAVTRVTVRSVAVTVMAIFKTVDGGTGGAVGYPNTTGPGDNMIVDGSVTVGATNTDKTLETMTVNGRVKCDGLKIEKWLFTQKSPPDYVFGKEYSLLDLDKVEEFIKTHGHLPEIPSAAVIQKSGLELTEFNMMLLKKIEELTLYTIELKKELGKIKIENTQSR